MDTITPKDAHVMAQLLKGTPLDLESQIFSHMETCMEKSYKGLPFGHVITDLLKLYGIYVPLAPEQEKCHVGVFGSQIISRMHYVRTISGWTLKTKMTSEMMKIAFVCFCLII